MNETPPPAQTAHAVETALLAALLETEGDYVSGTHLAKLVGLSRVAVWQHMEKMREMGFGFEAVRARGYRLTDKPSSLNADLIAAYLAPRKLSYHLRVHATVDSTNDEAARLLASGHPAPLIVASRRQTKGRGRFGRVWHSEDNGNLYISFGFRPTVVHARMATFTLWMGVSVCDLLANFTRAQPGLKWPNDILFDGRKAGGMLTEARVDSDQIRDLVYGLGLNVNSAADHWPEGLHQRAISLAEYLRNPLDVNRFTAALIGRVIDAYHQFIAGKHTDAMAERWARHDVLKGRDVAVLQGERRVAGVAAGIDDEGALLLKTKQGRTERFHAGEVTLEKTPPR